MTIYVSNLSFHTQSEDLSNLFAAYGAVESVKLITDRETNKSRGFGFVEMNDEKEATEAISKLNGQIIEGRALVVNVAHPKERRTFNSPASY